MDMPEIFLLHIAIISCWNEGLDMVSKFTGRGLKVGLL